MRYKRGDRVMIYDDPITKTTPEGEATVVKVAIPFNGESIYLIVRFDDGDIRDRWVYA